MSIDIVYQPVQAMCKLFLRIRIQEYFLQTAGSPVNLIIEPENYKLDPKCQDGRQQFDDRNQPYVTTVSLAYLGRPQLAFVIR
jgi:hypothetical protein